MGKYIYKGVERGNQLGFEHNTPENIIAAIDDGKTLTIFTNDVNEIEELKKEDKLKEKIIEALKKEVLAERRKNEIMKIKRIFFELKSEDREFLTRIIKLITCRSNLIEKQEKMLNILNKKIR